MTGSERQVLRIIKELKEATPEPISRKMAISSAYVGQLCGNLVRDGYLAKGSKEGYRLTPEGLRALEPYKGRGMGGALRGSGGVAVSIYP